ncbi:MAG: DnaD domain protein [Lactobacillales bacterium]|jgi:DNA replication protein|nr:DnaD domain protein [Lactobacillales bacterium]
MLELNKYLSAGVANLPNVVLDNLSTLGVGPIESIVWVHLFRLSERGERFPDFDYLGKLAGLPAEHVMKAIETLEQKQLLTIVDFEAYDFTCAYNTIEALFNQSERAVAASDTQNQIANLMASFEEEFKRAISPMEAQRIDMWLNTDGHAPVLVKEALSEAVLNNSMSFKYIEAILNSWEKSGLKTVEEVRAHSKKFNEGKFAARAPQPGSDYEPDLSGITGLNW